jgi:hypothetical protein
MINAKIDFAAVNILQIAEQIFRCNINRNDKLLFKIFRRNIAVKIRIFLRNFICTDNPCPFAERKQSAAERKAAPQGVSIRVGVG